MPRKFRRFVWIVAPLVLMVLSAAGAGPGAETALTVAQWTFRPLPDGFTPAGKVQSFGTTERRLADGTLYDYMDGAGEIYFQHGFTELHHVELADGAGHHIVMDIFAFHSAAQTAAAFADERICPAAWGAASLDAPHKAYEFPPDYFVYFHTGRHLVYLHVDDNRLKPVLDRFAQIVLSEFTKEVSP